MIKKTLKLLGVVALVLFGVMAFNAGRISAPVTGPVEAPAAFVLDTAAAIDRFAGALRFPTISPQNPADRDSSAFFALHDYIEEHWPLVHGHLQRETVAEMSLLYTWRGREPTLEPIVLMGHLDVVPVIPGTEGDWEQPPFGGIVADGYVWGRGALDDKSSVFALLESVEGMLATGFQPRRTIYLAFGHDEEVGGPAGAATMADMISDRVGGELAWVLDEGGAIVDGIFAGPGSPVAVVGIAEKGFASFELKIEGAGGHSSTPPRNTNIGILSEAITRLEANPFPTVMTHAAEATITATAHLQSFGMRLIVGNLWLTRPLVMAGMKADPTSAAMLRTTTAVTMFNAGIKDNVLPIEASAVVNFRIIPGETVETVRARIVEIIQDDRITVEPASSTFDPSPISDPNSDAFALLGRTIRQVVGERVTVAPYLVTGGTDARYYSGLSPNVFRFLPVLFEDGDMQRVHGTNERLTVNNYATAVRYFRQLLLNAEGY